MYGTAIDTVQKTITIGPAWLDIVSLTTEPREDDDRFNVTIVVRNQSKQALRGIQIDLVSADWTLNTAASAAFDSNTNPDRLAPGAVYTLRTWTGPWNGTLRARSSWCYSVSE
jgi:hypothetical protein